MKKFINLMTSYSVIVEKISGQLSDAMELAMDGLGTSDNADDQYNFGVDY